MSIIHRSYVPSTNGYIKPTISVRSIERCPTSGADLDIYNEHFGLRRSALSLSARRTLLMVPWLHAGAFASHNWFLIFFNTVANDRRRGVIFGCSAFR